MILTLYKYRSCRNEEEFGYLKDIIVNRNMWASCPTQLNDPYEWTPSFRSPTKQEVKEYRKEFIVRKTIGIKSIIKRIGKGYMKKIVNSFLKKESKYGDEKKWNNQVKKNGIVCLSEDKNNILMWSHYADSHKGIALEVSLNKDSLQAKRGPERVDIFKVKYSSDRVKCSFTCSDKKRNEIIRDVFTRKYECWEYEKEYRIIYKIKEESNYDKGELVQLPEGAIKKIILGARASTDLEEKLKKLVSDNNLDIPVKRARLDGTKYRVNV